MEIVIEAGDSLKTIQHLDEPCLVLWDIELVPCRRHGQLGTPAIHDYERLAEDEIPIIEDVGAAAACAAVGKAIRPFLLEVFHPCESAGNRYGNIRDEHGETGVGAAVGVVVILVGYEMFAGGGRTAIAPTGNMVPVFQFGGHDDGHQ